MGRQAGWRGGETPCHDGPGSTAPRDGVSPGGNGDRERHGLVAGLLDRSSDGGGVGGRAGHALPAGDAVGIGGADEDGVGAVAGVRLPRTRQGARGRVGGQREAVRERSRCMLEFLCRESETSQRGRFVRVGDDTKLGVIQSGGVDLATLEEAIARELQRIALSKLTQYIETSPGRELGGRDRVEASKWEVESSWCRVVGFFVEDQSMIARGGRRPGWPKIIIIFWGRVQARVRLVWVVCEQRRRSACGVCVRVRVATSD